MKLAKGKDWIYWFLTSKRINLYINADGGLVSEIYVY